LINSARTGRLFYSVDF